MVVFTTTAIITLALAAASAAASAAAAYKAAQDARARAAYQAQVARNNAITAGYMVEEAKQQGKAEEDRHRERIKQASGKVDPRRAAQGLLTDAGPGDTGTDIKADIAFFGELDINTIRHDTDVAAKSAQARATNFEAQAGLFEMQRSQISPGFNAGISLLGGAAKVAGTYNSIGNAQALAAKTKTPSPNYLSSRGYTDF